MSRITRRVLVASGVAVVSARAFAQTGHEHHGGAYESLRQPGRIGLPPIAEQQRVTDSAAPKAAAAARVNPAAPGTRRWP